MSFLNQSSQRRNRKKKVKLKIILQNVFWSIATFLNFNAALLSFNKNTLYIEAKYFFGKKKYFVLDHLFTGCIPGFSVGSIDFL